MYNKTRRIYRGNGLIDPTYYKALKKVIMDERNETNIEVKESKKKYWTWEFKNGKYEFGTSC